MTSEDGSLNPKADAIRANYRGLALAAFAPDLLKKLTGVTDTEADTASTDAFAEYVELCRAGRIQQ